MNDEKFYIVSIEDEILNDDLKQIVEIAKNKFQCVGHEEFSLNEEEVDKILGDEAFCGGDLSDELMEKLEREANKVYRFFFEGDDSKSRAEFFREFLVEAGIQKIELLEKNVEDWNETWKKHYSPIELGNWIIVPVWNSGEVFNEGKEKIVINPGMGFGTGTHETTRQCLMHLEELVNSGENFKTCLDFGAGSGILGIGFQKICGGDVDYVDIDQRALENNKDNLILNFPENTPESGFYLRSSYKVEKTYDLVFANILENVLIEEFDTISSSVSGGKYLIVSGLLKEQKQKILNIYKTKFNFLKEKIEGDWLALSFVKK